MIKGGELMFVPFMPRHPIPGMARHQEPELHVPIRRDDGTFGGNAVWSVPEHVARRICIDIEYDGPECFEDLPA